MVLLFKLFHFALLTILMAQQLIPWGLNKEFLALFCVRTNLGKKLLEIGFGLGVLSSDLITLFWFS